MNGLGEPEDCNADDGDAFDEGSDGVSDGRSGSEDYEGDDVLGEMDGAVEEEIVYDGVQGGGLFFIIAAEVGVVFWSVVCGNELWKVVVEPNGDHEDESHGGGIK